MNAARNPTKQLLEQTLHNITLKANSNGECCGGDIVDAMRDAGEALEVDRLEVLVTRTLLMRAMESSGEEYPAEVLQDYEHRMPASQAVSYLRAAIERTTKMKDSTTV